MYHTVRSDAALPPDLSAGSCASTDPDAFFPEPGVNPILAKRVCMDCPVRSECLSWALETRQPAGVWGGFSAQERKKMLANSGVDLAVCDEDAA